MMASVRSNSGSTTPSGSQGSSSSMQMMSTANSLPLNGSVCKVKGLPFKATAADVLSFFGAFSLRQESVYLKRHPDGRPNGEAFVVFESADEAQRATHKDRETFGEKFGDRYVRVYPTLESDVADMQAVVAQQVAPSVHGAHHPHGHMDSVVKIKSLPFDANQLDIIHFFEAFKLKPNGVQLVVRPDNKPTGEAFVDFESCEEAVRAIRDKDHKVFSEKFGDRYVRLIQVSRKEMQATLALRFGGEGILKMKGIPFKATAADVRKFFSAFKIKPDGISFIMHADGRPTGMAFIEFETPQEAVRGMERDRARFGPEYGDRYCMLQLVGRHEMDKVMLQRESEANTHKLLNGINVLQAAAIATQAALNNPALQPILMAGGNPWLSPLHPLHSLMTNPAAAASLLNNPNAVNLLNPAHSAALANAQLGGLGNHLSTQGSQGSGPLLDAAGALAAATQYSGQLGPNATALNPDVNSVGANLSQLSLLHANSQSAMQQLHTASLPVDSTTQWLSNVAAAAASASSHPLLYFHNQASAEWLRATNAGDSRQLHL